MKAPFYSFNFIFFQSEITQESFRAFTAFLTASLLFPATINFISSAILKQKKAKRNINLDICSIFDIGILEGKKKEERGKLSDHGESVVARGKSMHLHVHRSWLHPRKIPRRRNGAVAISSDPVTSLAGGIDYFQEKERERERSPL